MKRHSSWLCWLLCFTFCQGDCTFWGIECPFVCQRSQTGLFTVYLWKRRPLFWIHMDICKVVFRYTWVDKIDIIQILILIVSLVSMVLPLVQNFIQQQHECKWQNLRFFGKPCGPGYPIRLTGWIRYRHSRKRLILPVAQSSRTSSCFQVGWFFPATTYTSLEASHEAW